jgi:hypothetical protein
MAKEYSVSGDGLTLANQAVTLVFFNPTAAPNPDYEVFRIWCSQSGTATSAMQRVQVETQAALFPNLTAATPRQLKTADTVASLIVGGTAGAAGTAGVNASAELNGAKTVRFPDNFNNLNGYLWVPTPREQISMTSGFAQGLGLFLPVAPTSLSNWAAGMNYAEGL